MSKDKEAVVERLRSRTKPENRIFIAKNLAISEQVYCLLKEKGWSQKELAKRLGKHDSEVSRWLTGLHNITMESIAKIEAVLEADVITTPLEACKKYKTVEVKWVVFANVNPDQTITRTYSESVSWADKNLETMLA